MSDYLGKEVLAAAKTVVAGTVEIVVEQRSQVVTIAPASGTSLTEDDSCELYVKIGETRTIATGFKFGASLPSREVVGRGRYILNRISITTEDVGGYVKDGMQATR